MSFSVWKRNKSWNALIYLWYVLEQRGKSKRRWTNKRFLIQVFSRTKWICCLVSKALRYRLVMLLVLQKSPYVKSKKGAVIIWFWSLDITRSLFQRLTFAVLLFFSCALYVYIYPSLRFRTLVTDVFIILINW